MWEYQRESLLEQLKCMEDGLALEAMGVQIVQDIVLNMALTQFLNNHSTKLFDFQLVQIQ